MRLRNPFTVKTWAIIAFIVIVGLGLLSWRGACTAAKNAKAEAGQATVVADQLDKVAAETPVIRHDQQEKQREVDEIGGADQRLPDGFGADLERVRRGGEHRNP